MADSYRDVWVDFNSAQSGWVETLVEFAAPGVSLELGAEVVVGDDDGLRCSGTVIQNDGFLVRIALELDGSESDQVHSPEVALA